MTRNVSEPPGRQVVTNRAVPVTVSGMTTAPVESELHSPAPDPACVENQHRRPTIFGLDTVGLIGALFFFAWSLSPSLIPRTWLYQGLVSGVSAITGYGVALLLAWPVRRWVVSRVPAWLARGRAALTLRIVVAALTTVTVIGSVLVAASQQRDIENLMGMDNTASVPYLRTGAFAVAIFLVVLVIARGLRRLARAFAGMLHRRLRVPQAMAHVVAPVVVIAIAAVFVDQVLLAGGSGAARLVFSAQNNSTEDGVSQPTEPERSGSAVSAASWETLGMQGRSFVDGGLRAEDLTTLNGAPAKEPIRVYAGLESAAGIGAQVQLVLDELDRTRAWDRRILVVSATTGTGWINPVAADSIEMIYNGDSAIAAVQYSYLPSWLSFLFDGTAAATAGSALIRGVHERWSQLPADHRPQLVVYGESLGSQSAESAFGGIEDLRSSVDGALLVGPPNTNPIWSELVSGRDAGSPEVLPVADGGAAVRFAATIGDAVSDAESGTTWRTPRVLYLQHASDPVVWWSPDLLFSRPDWLAEPAGPGRVPSMRWYPVVTFWQLAADIMRGTSPPVGFGHNYENLIPYGWAAVIPPHGWTNTDTERIATAVAQMHTAAN